MATRSSPTVWRRWLAGELRRLRDESGLSQKDVGKHCGWSGVRVSYLENAQQNVADDDLDRLLPLYDVRVDDRVRYYEAAKLAREKGWWELGPEHDLPEYVTPYVGFEQGATLIRTVEPYAVPGLLQTRAYCEAALRTDATRRTPQQIARIADLRHARQSILHDPDEPTRLDVVIDESVLRRVVGGYGVMAEQLKHLVAMAERPNVQIRVFPFSRGVHRGMVGGYRILEFGALGLPVVYIERWEDATYLFDTESVERQMLAFMGTTDVALDERASADVLHEAASQYAAG